MKKNWKKMYEETAGLLKLARDGNELLNVRVVAAKQELANRPTVEKIVEKEVFEPPKWLLVLLLVGFTSALCVGSWQRAQIQKLQTPILSPYPVYVAKYVPPDPYALDVCKDAWRADERELRKLRRNQKEN